MALLDVDFEAKLAADRARAAHSVLAGLGARGLNRLLLVKGDRVEVLVDVGGGVAQRFEIVARRAGRRVDVSNVRGTVEVSETTRSGTPIRTARFMASRVIAIVEHPASDPTTD
jgi:hypothetical protein